MGGRSIYYVQYKAAFDVTTGICKAVDATIFADCGCTNNDNGGAGYLFALHGDGPYQVENYRYKFVYVRTARPAVTWLRAPGMLQAALVIEAVIDHGIREFNLDQYQSRLVNLVKPGFTPLVGVPETTDRASATFETFKQ